MKRPLAIAFTIAIFTAVAVCFLRPAPSDFGYTDQVYRFNEVTEVDISGDANGKIRLFDCGTAVSHGSYGRRFNVESLGPEKVYMSGAEYNYIYNTGTENGGLYRENGEHLRQMYSLYDYALLHAAQYIGFGKQTSTFIETTVAEPGRYRAVMHFYEVGSGEKSVVEYPFEIPERTSSPYDVIAVNLERLPKSPDAAGLYAVIRINSGEELHTMGNDSLRFDRLTENGYESVESTSDDWPAVCWGLVNDRNIWGDSDFPDLPLYGVCGIALRGWNEHDEYRLSVDMADGSGEQYTLTLDLRFDE